MDKNVVIEDEEKAFQSSFRRSSGEAFREALRKGIPVVVSSNGSMIECRMVNGRLQRKHIKSTEKPVKIERSGPIHFKR